MSIFKDKTVLVTGGAGFFGQKFVQVLLKEHNPKSVRVYDNREAACVEMERNCNNPKVRFFIGDVRDEQRLLRAMEGVDIVIHAAAIKHVPICEYNPIEAVKTNINGAINVINAALDKNVDRVMAISTDKAVYPVNLYGATKMVAEKIFVQANSYRGNGNTKFSCTRYGNVIASSGSVIPLFLEQRKQREITITNVNMTRFWINLESGINFVIDSTERMRGGEIFIPKIPSMKIMDLAKSIAPQAQIKITGIRPGEKLHEVLLTADEARHSKELDTYFVIEPEFPFWQKDNFKEGKDLEKGFKYASDTNGQWLCEQDLIDILKTF